MRRCTQALLIGTALGALTIGEPIFPGLLCRALAQDVKVTVDFRATLEPYGRWVSHQRWHDVWVPSNVPRGWRPYTRGHWAYTDEWGWYWIADEDFGWVTDHYGRWVREADLGWVWVPGDQWAPAWVRWRRGTQAVGWAPMPPDEILVEEDERPNTETWVFVRTRDLTQPRITTVFLPARETEIYIRETVVVNRTVSLGDRGTRIAVNPGISPAFIAAASGRPIRAVEIRPPVVAGTTTFQGAVQVQAGTRTRPQVTVRETTTVIQPAKNVPPPTALPAGERGRLGETPPKAAQQAAPPTTPPAGPAQPAPQQPGATGAQPQPPAQPQQPPGTTPGTPPAKSEPPPAAKSPAPPAKTPTPPAKSEQPPAKSESPAPPAKSAPPPAGRPEPPAPPAKSERPPAKSEPPVKSERPPAKSEPPPAKSERPPAKPEPAGPPAKSEQPAPPAKSQPPSGARPQPPASEKRAPAGEKKAPEREPK